MSSPFLLFGDRGQMGRALSRALAAKGLPFRALGRAECDLASPDRARLWVESEKPSAVLLAGAYTQVDRAESEGALARRVNAEAPGEIADACARLGIPLLHFSTDYVFSGEGEKPWTEEDEASPLSVYGETKREGERRVLESGARALLFRTSWIYDEEGRNFPNTMRKLARERDELRVVDDQYGAPTYAADLAEASLAALLRVLKDPDAPTGLFHAANAGETTWFGLAEAVLHRAKERGEAVRARLVPIPSSEYPTPARRPRNSRLDCRKLKRCFGLSLPPWEEALARCSLGWR